MNKNLALAKYTLVLVCCIFAGGVFGQEPAYPIPTGDPNQLFYLQRTSNSNTVVYGLNYKNGALDPEEPVNAYWIRYADQGQKSDLTFLQRHFAYGIKATKDGDDQYKLLFTAYKDITMTLQKTTAGKYAVFVTIDQKPAILSKVYLQINGGSFWSPDIRYAEFTGADPVTGAVLRQRFDIKP